MSIVAESPVYEEIDDNYKEGIYEEIAEVRRRDPVPVAAAAATPAAAIPPQASESQLHESVQTWLESIGLVSYYEALTSIQRYQTLEGCTQIDEDDALNEVCISDSRDVKTIVAASRELGVQLKAAAATTPPLQKVAQPAATAPPAVAAAITPPPPEPPLARELADTTPTKKTKPPPPPPGRTTSLQPPPAADVPVAVAPEPEVPPAIAVDATLPPADTPKTVLSIPTQADVLHINTHDTQPDIAPLSLPDPDHVGCDTASSGGPPPTPPLRPTMAPLAPNMVGADPWVDAGTPPVEAAALPLQKEVTDSDQQPAAPAVALVQEDDIYENTPGSAVRSGSSSAVHASLPKGPRQSVKQRTKDNMKAHPMLQTPDHEGPGPRHDSMNSQWSVEDNDADTLDSDAGIVDSPPPPVITFNVPPPPPPATPPPRSAAVRLSIVTESPDESAVASPPKAATKPPTARPAPAAARLPPARGGITRSGNERASVQAIRKRGADTSGVRDSITAALAAGPQFMPTSGGLKGSDEPQVQAPSTS